MAKAISETQNMLDPSKIKLLSDLVKSRLGNQHGEFFKKEWHTITVPCRMKYGLQLRMP
jgi:hypothetical protein